MTAPATPNPSAPRPTEAVRAHWVDLINTLLGAGDTAAAEQCAALAVEQGVWRHPQQRPLHYLPALPPVPVHATDDFWFVPYLEENAHLIRAEFDAVLDPVSSGFQPVEEPLLGRGDWKQMIFYEAGQRFDEVCRRFPVTTDIVEAIPEAASGGPGVITLSWLQPGTTIIPHCGNSNAKLRLHLALKVPDGARMRVGPETVHWTEGRCVLFDDSFEHQVWHDGTEPRLVLLLDVWHPDVDETIRRWMVERRGGLDEQVTTFMLEHGIERAELADGDVRLRPTERVGALIRRHLHQAGATAVHLRDGRPQLEGTER